MNNISMGSYGSIEQASKALNKENVKKNSNSNLDVTFSDILANKRQIVEENTKKEIAFSKHADMRLKQRDIMLTKDQMLRLNEAADKARDKGIKDSLVIMDNLAFIVNTKNKMVVTAMEQGVSDENIYTNIDGAVII